MLQSQGARGINLVFILRNPVTIIDSILPGIVQSKDY